MLRTGGHLILGFESESEPDEVDDGAGWMGSLMSLRSDPCAATSAAFISDGSFALQKEEVAEDGLGPSMPAGLGELSAPLHELIEFLGIDEDLVEVAASASPPLSASPSRKELVLWIQSLSETEKNDLLVAALLETGERWKNEPCCGSLC